MPPRDWQFYFITDSDLTRQGIFADAEAAIRGGAKVIQYREKMFSHNSKVDEATRLAALCRSESVDLIINDDPELARIVNAAGVHLGPHDKPLAEVRPFFPGIIGVSCNTVEEARQAEGGGADYIAAGPIYSTTTKPDIRPILGLGGLAGLRKATGLPVVAIGGISLADVPEVLEAGADAVCAITASVDVEDVEVSVRQFEMQIAQFKN